MTSSKKMIFIKGEVFTKARLHVKQELSNVKEDFHEKEWLSP